MCQITQISTGQVGLNLFLKTTFTQENSMEEQNQSFPTRITFGFRIPPGSHQDPAIAGTFGFRIPSGSHQDPAFVMTFGFRIPSGSHQDPAFAGTFGFRIPPGSWILQGTKDIADVFERNYVKEICGRNCQNSMMVMLPTIKESLNRNQRLNCFRQLSFPSSFLYFTLILNYYYCWILSLCGIEVIIYHTFQLNVLT